MVDAKSAELLRTWIAALRSGKYAQCRGFMYEGDGGYLAIGGRFCAIGVLNAVRADELCDGVLDEGLVIMMNDTLGYSFAEIADRIEGIFPDVFESQPEEALELAHA